MGRAKLEPRVSDHLTATIQPFILQLLTPRSRNFVWRIPVKYSISSAYEGFGLF
jgi:hypothetical protein